MHPNLVRNLLLGEADMHEIATKLFSKVFTRLFHTLQSSHHACTIVAHSKSPFWLYTLLDRSISIGKVVRTIVFTRSDDDAD